MQSPLSCFRQQNAQKPNVHCARAARLHPAQCCRPRRLAAAASGLAAGDPSGVSPGRSRLRVALLGESVSGGAPPAAGAPRAGAGARKPPEAILGE